MIKYPLVSLCWLLMLGNTLAQNEVIFYDDFENCENSKWHAVSDINDQSTSEQWTCFLTAVTGYSQIQVASNAFEKDWLISDQISVPNQKDNYFSFQYRTGQNFKSDHLKLFYSTDFNGVNSSESIASATWTEINLKLLDEDTKGLSGVFFIHPALDLNILAGQYIYLGFQFSSDNQGTNVQLDETIWSSGYYTQIGREIEDRNLSCASLKTELFQLIKDHNVIPYTGSEYDVWDSHYSTDLRLNDAGDQYIIWDIYSDRPNGAEPYEYKIYEDRDFGENSDEEGISYNREHSFPRSWWGGTQDVPHFSDIHHIYPADKEVNSQRLNFPMGETDSPFFTSQNGSKVGNASSTLFNGTIFEPIDEYKGDIARIFLYSATRYENLIANWENSISSADDALNGTDYPSYEDWQIQTFLKWHEQDPVSQKEIDRNNAIFAIQNNRNPYIDHPEYVGMTWGLADGTACQDVISASDDLIPTENEMFIFPNPGFDILTVKIKAPNKFKLLNILDINGKVVKQININAGTEVLRIGIDNIPIGDYFVELLGQNNKSIGKLLKL